MYGHFFTKLCENAEPYWNQYIDHKFVRDVQQGSLPLKSFKFYLQQDYLFLINFSRAWALAVVKAGTLEEMKYAANLMNLLINYELEFHIKFCASYGITEEELFAAAEELPNIAYTRYVLDVGLNGDFLDLICALVPCPLGYGQVGHNFAKVSIDQENIYHSWIKNYSDNVYQESCHRFGKLLDKSIRERLGPRPEETPHWEKLQKIFVQATRLEINFWNMCV